MKTTNQKTFFRFSFISQIRNRIFKKIWKRLCETHVRLVQNTISKCFFHSYKLYEYRLFSAMENRNYFLYFCSVQIKKRALLCNNRRVWAEHFNESESSSRWRSVSLVQTRTPPSMGLPFLGVILWKNIIISVGVTVLWYEWSSEYKKTVENLNVS